MDFKGAYILILYLSKDTIIKTKAKEFYLKKGYYAYVGSAMNGMKRVLRHLKKNKKKHWHIDYLTEVAEIKHIILIPSERKIEKEISLLISKIGKAIEGFGASDLKIKSNLYYFKENPFEKIRETLKENKINFEIFSPDNAKGRI